MPTPTLALGGNITFFGLARASDTVINPSGTDSQGRAIYSVLFGFSFELVIEGRPGSDGKPLGLSTFNYEPTDPTVRPDLQILVSRPLGNGSPAVCDNMAPSIGGVPAIDPPDFSETQTISDAINDLGCRFNDGTGNPLGRPDSLDACTEFPDGTFHFVDPDSTVQFCGSIAVPYGFPAGDTIVTARLRDVDGVVGPASQIVVRVMNSVITPQVTVSPIPINTPTPTPTPVPPPGGDGEITFFGLAVASDTLVSPSGVDGEGRPIYRQLSGRGFNIIIEARPLVSSDPLGFSAFNYDPNDPTIRPDLQMLVSRQLGNGSPAVCDNSSPNFGGIPAIDPPDFSATQPISDAINDLGCRVNDGTGNPSGRGSDEACVEFPDGTFHFVDSTSTVEFCLPIASAYPFQTGDTIVTARIRNGPAQQIVVRIGS